VFIFVSPFVAAQLRISHCNEQFKGMANVVCEILIKEAPLAAGPSDIAGAGAVVDFWGVVRPIEDGREIEGIEYDAHCEMAEHQLKRIAEQAVERFGLKLVIAHHRIGFIAIGEASLFLRVASSHRSESFRASQWIVDELKKKVPIWKRPRFRAPLAGVADAGPGSPIPATTNATTV
jgi:molybdopterin synthase catalytic subunit